MIEEMRVMAERQIINKQAKRKYLAGLNEMTERFFAGGAMKPSHDVGGMVMRHPVFEQFSLVPSRFYFDPTIEDDVIRLAVAHRTVNVAGKSKKRSEEHTSELQSH